MSSPLTVDQPRDVLFVHAISVLGMAVMLVAAVPRWATGVGLLVFSVATGWCLVQALQRRTPAVHLRLALCCAAMVVMLSPLVTASAAAGGHAMHGMSVTASPSWIALALAGALLVVAATVVVTGARAHLRSGHRRPRPSAAVEPVLAVVMAAMLVGHV